MKRLFKILMHPYLWIAIISFLSWQQAYRLIHPVISSIPLLTPGQPVAIFGQAFGAGQGGQVQFISGSQITPANIQEWSEKKITAAWPEGIPPSGYVCVIRDFGLFHWPSKRFCYVIKDATLPSQPYGYEVPVQAASPWPLFRRDHRNSGRSPIKAAYHGDKPWVFATGKGVFSSPVIDASGVIYIGSADKNFYAINPDGSEKWHAATGEIIDSAAALHADNAISFISGDGLMYHLRTDAPADRTLWTFDAKSLPGAGYINWWEGNTAIGYDGAIYAGNTNWNYYAINPDGTPRWNYATGNNCWSMTAFGEDGSLYWGALDCKVRRVAPDGAELWSKYTWGPVAASAALGSDGTVYIGSFDSYFYALDGATGKTRWAFKTGDHIYASAALAADAQGNTTAIYIPSTDGMLHALDPAGRLLWTYDTGDPIRCSPVIGPAPEGGDIVYFGSGNGVFYALNAVTGERRWSFNTTPASPELRDRNDLNASPALGSTGVYFAGESGGVCYIPYDYPLNVQDARCSTSPGEDLPNATTGLFYVTSGGTTCRQAPESVAPATVLSFRLIARERGATLDARIDKNTLSIESIPETPHDFAVSGDGHYLYFTPKSFLKPGGELHLKISGAWLSGGLNIGNLTLGGEIKGEFNNTFLFHVAAPALPRPPISITESKATAFEWTRLAVPMPAMMPSLNQIGFDSMDCLVSPAWISAPGPDGRGKAILWMTSAHREPDGSLEIPPAPDFMTPLNADYAGDNFIICNRDLHMEVMGLDIPFDIFDLRAQFNRDLTVRPGATAYAESRILSIPTYGPLLVLSGIASNVAEKLVVNGTFVTRPYDGPAAIRPEGISVQNVSFAAPGEKELGRVRVTFTLAPGAAWPAATHRPAIFLVDSAANEAVFLDYKHNIDVGVDAQGNLQSLVLVLPPGTRLPKTLGAVIMLDAYPLDTRSIF